MIERAARKIFDSIGGASSGDPDLADELEPARGRPSALADFQRLFGGPPSPLLLRRLASKPASDAARFWQDVESIAARQRRGVSA